jgi:hypothetical protein
LVAAAGGTLAAGRWIAGRGIAAAAAPAPRAAPRYFVQLVLDGGVDAITTFAPKSPSEAESWVDRPYNASEIVDGGGIAIGPHWKALAPWLSTMAIIQAVEVATANHESGTEHLTRLRTGTSASMPTILDVIGQHRDGQPLGSIHLGFAFPTEYSPGWLADTIASSQYRYGVAAKTKSFLQLYDELDATKAQTVADALAREAKRLDATGDTVSGANARAASELYRRRGSVSPLVQPPTVEDSDQQRMMRSFARCLWLLENDLARCVFIRPLQQVWDTHTDNEIQQQPLNVAFARAFAWFLAELQARHRGAANLDSQTAVIVSSELGRFPRLNAAKGKDHFPQSFYLLRGPGVVSSKEAGTVFSPVGKMMESLPIAMKTGRPEKGGRHLQIDDVGATMLTLAGLDPVLYGYTGQVMRFVLA